jgi:hypothetical protein
MADAWTTSEYNRLFQDRPPTQPHAPSGDELDALASEFGRSTKAVYKRSVGDHVSQPRLTSTLMDDGQSIICRFCGSRRARTLQTGGVCPVCGSWDPDSDDNREAAERFLAARPTPPPGTRQKQRP